MKSNIPYTKAWLARHPLTDDALRRAWAPRLTLLSAPTAAEGSVLASAVTELNRGVKELLGHRLVPTSGPSPTGVTLELGGSGPAEGFELTVGPRSLHLKAATEVGLLYGVFRLLDLVACGAVPVEGVVVDAPRARHRMLNHWDNADGSIERGYAGASLFFANNRLKKPGPRLRDYARLCASVGINALCINNVNVHHHETALVTPRHAQALAQLAAVFRPWGIRLYLSVNFAAPVTLGELTTSDPLDPAVVAWWTACARALWTAVPDLGGFVVKADSEGRPGPFTYQRTHADGANLLARAVAPYGATVFWRCFVYNHQQDWRDRTTDRARAAYDHFLPLDGQFDDNVVLQIKNGPMDFQPREPVSPLLGAQEHTRQALELQITQEYLGQQRHLCYLPEQWRTYLDFDTQRPGRGRVASFVQALVGVANVGHDANWTGHDLAQANWFGFGRMAWNPEGDPASLAKEWAALTFGAQNPAATVVAGLLLGSWQTYEAYTAPLGLGWLVNPSHHYGPNPDGYEYDRWGTYHFADRDGVGVDRTASGSGYVDQYSPAVARLYSQLETCPPELLLFFHHVPYHHRLPSGKTVLQHIYDTHFAGVLWAEQRERTWQTLRGLVDQALFERVRARLAEQSTHAALWRDVINTYFFRRTGVADASGRLIHR